MVSKVAEDPGLLPGVRQRATALRSVAHSDPALARQLLADLADEVRIALARSSPTSDLCRVVSLSTFFTHHLSDDARSYYLSDDEYLAHLRSIDAGRELLTDLSTDATLFRAHRSWLVACRDITGLAGQDLKRALGLRGNPPYVVFELSRTSLIAAGVTVRPARSVDAVPQWFTEWDPAGLPTGLPEMVDGDVPRAALSRIRLVD
jgi:hypothetical protein